MKLIIKFLLFLVAFWGTARFCKSKTDGFAVAKIIPSSPIEYWTLPPSDELEAIFKQPFSYLGKGVQSYVFASKDGNYVLKLLRQDRIEPRLWTHHVERRQNRKLKDFNSYKIAYDELPKETGLIYLHLRPTNFFKQKATIIDKIGIAHTLDLDKLEFIVQRKATLVFPTLQNLMLKNRVAEAKEALGSLVKVLKTRLEKGIFDKDPDLNTNFGFIGAKAIQIDIGRLRYNGERVTKDEIIRITDNLHQWLMTRYPELDTYLKEKIDEI